MMIIVMLIVMVILITIMNNNYNDNNNYVCVQDAVLRGWFRTNRSPTSGQPDLRTVAMTALEIASAMVFLHSNNVVHGVR